MSKATVIAADPGQRPDTLLLHRSFEIVEDHRVEGGIGDKGVAVGCDWASFEFAKAHFAASGLGVGVIADTGVCTHDCVSVDWTEEDAIIEDHCGQSSQKAAANTSATNLCCHQHHPQHGPEYQARYA